MDDFYREEGPSSRLSALARLWSRFASTEVTAPLAVKKKDASIETLRGLAILMLVAYHCVDLPADARAGTVDLQHMAFSLTYVRMPLFSVISGFVYALRPIDPSRPLQFLRGKARRLLLPLISVTTLMVALRSGLSGSGARFEASELWRAYVYPYEHLWFLQASMLIFVLMVVIERLGLLSTPRRLLLTLLATTAIGIAPIFSLVFAFTGMLYILPFFVLGVGIARFHDQIFTKPIVTLAVVGALVGTTLHQLWWFGHVEIDVVRRSPLSYVAGLSAILLLVHLRRPVRWLAQLGYYSYGIYLFHLIAISVAARGGIKLGLEHEALLFGWKWALGLTIPIVAELAILRVPVARRVLLGLK